MEARYPIFELADDVRPVPAPKLRFTVVYEGPPGCEKELAQEMKAERRGRGCKAIKAFPGDWLTEDVLRGGCPAPETNRPAARRVRQA